MPILNALNAEQNKTLLESYLNLHTEKHTLAYLEFMKQIVNIEFSLNLLAGLLEKDAVLSEEAGSKISLSQLLKHNQILFKNMIRKADAATLHQITYFSLMESIQALPYL